METPIYLKSASWSEGVYTLTVTVSDRSGGGRSGRGESKESLESGELAEAGVEAVVRADRDIVAAETLVRGAGAAAGSRVLVHAESIAADAAPEDEQRGLRRRGPHCRRLRVAGEAEGGSGGENGGRQERVRGGREKWPAFWRLRTFLIREPGRGSDRDLKALRLGGLPSPVPARQGARVRDRLPCSPSLRLPGPWPSSFTWRRPKGADGT